VILNTAVTTMDPEPGLTLAAQENASVRVSGSLPLYGPAFSQVALDRQGQS
jgi:hypothetical protein